MSKIMKKSLVLIALLMVASAAAAQTPVLKKPVLAPQAKPSIKPILPKTAITIVDAGAIARSSQNRTEAARRLKAQNVSSTAALSALRGAFGVGDREEGQALRAAGYVDLEVLAAIKQADGLDPLAMLIRMGQIGILPSERASLAQRLYALDFDALLAAMRRTDLGSTAFGYALDAMDYSVEQMVQTGYRYFNGGYSNPGSAGGPYPAPREMYRLLTLLPPLAQRTQIDHHSLFVLLINSGYPPAGVMQDVPMGVYNPRDGTPMDAISSCVVRTGLSVDDPRMAGSFVNPRLLIRVMPDGSASHSDAQRSCFVEFLGLLRTKGARRQSAEVLADNSIACIPATSPICTAQHAEVAERMVSEAGYPAEKR